MAGPLPHLLPLSPLPPHTTRTHVVCARENDIQFSEVFICICNSYASKLSLRILFVLRLRLRSPACCPYSPLSISSCLPLPASHRAAQLFAFQIISLWQPLSNMLLPLLSLLPCSATCCSALACCCNMLQLNLLAGIFRLLRLTAFFANFTAEPRLGFNGFLFYLFFILY